MRTRLRCLVIILLVALIPACSITSEDTVPPIAYGDLIGKWTADYSQYDDPTFAVQLPAGGIETLILHGDGTFEQDFMKNAGIPFQKHVSGTWRAKKISNAYTRISLKGAMYYLSGIIAANDPTYGVVTWDPILGQDVEIKSGFVVLYATRLSMDSKYDSKVPCGKKDDLVLQHLPIGDLDAPTWVTFCRE